MSTKGLALKLGLVNSSKIPVPLPMSIPIHSTTPVTDNRRRSRIPLAEVDTSCGSPFKSWCFEETTGATTSLFPTSVCTTVGQLQHNVNVSEYLWTVGTARSVLNPLFVAAGSVMTVLRVMSLTVAGRLHSHGPGCPGSGQLPGDGSITNLSQSERNAVQLTTSQPNLGGNGSSASAPAPSPVDIMDLLGQQRRRVLKRVPKALRISAAEKLAETLLQVITVPTCVDKWKNLLTFTYAWSAWW